MLLIFLSVLLLAPGWGRSVDAQVNMPDLRQVSGVPLPAQDAPAGTISVRVVRGSFANNLANVEVTFTIDGKPRAIKTDDAGRAQVTGLKRGTTVHASAVVDGERLETQPVTVADTGVRFVLAAADPDTVAREAENAQLAAGPATKGTIVLGEETQFIAEFSNDRLNLRYTLSILNTARTPVDIGGPLVFELPRGARGVTLAEGTTKQATANGPRVVVLGPFAPGTTPIAFDFELPYDGPTAHFEQRIPAALQSIVFAVFKTGDMDLSSPQLPRKQSTVFDGQPVVVAMGPAIAPGQSFVMDITGLPHRVRWPRIIALSLASFIVLAGVWAAVVPGSRRSTRG